MRMVDKNAVHSSLVSKLISNFFGSSSSSKVVMDLIEDKESKLMFAAVNDAHSKDPDTAIEVYSISKDDFSKIGTITLRDVFKALEIRLKTESTLFKSFALLKLELLKLNYDS